ncbi:MAG: TolC family protein [Legionella sp.]|uniref:TolC family protein n=1 Tax=Legionella sp. TaxID=459 RepID=UPI00284A6D6E|nr:TolC family protein [Legionella sp.]
MTKTSFTIKMQIAVSLLFCSGSTAAAAPENVSTDPINLRPALTGSGLPKQETAASKTDASKIGTKDKRYDQELRRYCAEAKYQGTAPSLPALKPVVSNSETTRTMPPLPNKSIHFSDSLLETSDDNHSIFKHDALVLERPKLSGLINVQTNLNPLDLDASAVQSANLRELLTLAVENNLDIAVSRNRIKAQHYRYLGALGGFLPDLSLSDHQLWLNGKIGVPLNGGLNSILGVSSGGANPRTLRLTGPITIGTAGFDYHVYQGGKVLFTALQNKHQLRAAGATFHANYSDTLLEVSKRYYQLVLTETLLQIRIRAANTSEEQVRVNTKRFEEGFGTNLDVLQARTQLSLDRQSLLEQQVNRREASINLAALINYDLADDIEPSEEIQQITLLSPKMPIARFLQVAISNRAELKEFAELRKAAKAQIVVAGSKLQPQVDLSGNVYGIGRTPSSTEALFVLGLNVNWQLGGLGTIDAANIAAAKVDARNANLAVQQELVNISQEVRIAYLRCAAAEKNISETDNQVASAFEELRLAKVRYQNGVGTNLDILTAQRDYTQAQINKATAIVNQNIAQVQFVRSVGLVTVDNLASKKSII